MIIPSSAARGLLELLDNAPKSRTQVSRQLALFDAEDLRPATVSDLLRELVNARLLATTDGDLFCLTISGRELLAADRDGRQR